MVGKFRLSFDQCLGIIWFALSNHLEVETKKMAEGALSSLGTLQIMKFINGDLTPVIAIKEVNLKKMNLVLF